MINFKINVFNKFDKSNKIEMINSPKAVSSMSGDTTEVRYQKALKEITKLIGVNNEIKQQMARAQDAIAQYQQGLRERDEKIDDLLQNIDMLQKEKNNLSLRCMDLQQQNNSLIDELNAIRNKTSIENDLPNKQFELDIRTSNKSRQNTNEYRRIIDQLEMTLQRKNQIIKELSLKTDEYTKRSSLMENIFGSKFLQKNQMGLSQADLLNKVNASNQYIQKLSEQCADLKSKLLKVENVNTLLRVRSQKNFKNFSPAISPRNGLYQQNEEVGAEIHKRYRKLEHDYMKVVKKSDTTQKQLHKLKKQHQNVLKDTESAKKKLEKYEILIEKQQKQIEQMMKSYDNTIIQMTEQFKQKLQQQRQSFNPTKNAKTLKMVEALQSQNKSLKKKFQLCSIQLTKCFKTLQIYKSKLAQCEQQYNELAQQKQQILEKLNRMQQGGRQKSIKSKGSNSRFLVDGNEGQASIDYSP